MESRLAPTTLSQMHTLSRQGIDLPRPSSRFDTEPYIGPTKAHLRAGTVFFRLELDAQDHLVDSALRLLHAYDATAETKVFENPVARADMVSEAAEHTRWLIDYGWTSAQAVRLALRHSAEDIRRLAVEFGTLPIFTDKRLMSYIASNATSPRRTLQSVVDAFYDIRVRDRVLQPSNSAIHKALKTKALRNKDYSAIYALQQEAYKPLSEDPEQALMELQSFTRQQSTFTSAKIDPTLANFVQAAIKPAAIQERQNSDRPWYIVDFPHFSEIVARYADLHDYDLVQDTEQLQRIAMRFMQEVAILEAYEIPTSTAEYCVMRMLADSYKQAIEDWDLHGLPRGKRNAILKTHPLAAPELLTAVRQNFTQLQSDAPHIVATNAIELALGAAEKKQPIEERLQEFEDDVATCAILYGSSLTVGYIGQTCAKFPGTYTKRLSATLSRLGDFTTKWHDPCMPKHFLQRAAESSLADATDIVREHVAKIREVRSLYAKNGKSISDQDLWRLVRSQVSDTRI